MYLQHTSSVYTTRSIMILYADSVLAGNTRWVRSKEGNLEWLPTPLVGNARIWLKNALLKEMNPGWKEKMRKGRSRIQDTLAIENPELSELLAYSDDEREDEAQTQSEPENNSMEAASEDTQP